MNYFLKSSNKLFALFEFLKLEFLIKTKYRNHYIFIPPSAFGDAMHLYILLKSIKEKYGQAKVLIIVQNKIKEDLAKMFEDVDETIIINSKSLFSKLEKNRKLFFSKLLANKKLIKIQKGQIISYAVFQIDNMCFHRDMVDANRNILKLGSQVKFGKLKNSRPLNKMENNKKRIVLISPFSNSLATCHFDSQFWKNIADNFVQKGYDVIFNSNIKDFASYNQKFLPISQMVDIARNCDLIIGLRSGFMDVISFALDGPKIFVIYPSNKALHKHVFNNLFANFSYDLEKNFSDNFFFHNLKDIPKAQEIEKILKSNQLNEQFLDNELWKILSPYCAYDQNKSFSQNFLAYFSLKKMFNKDIKEIIFESEEKTINLLLQ